MAIPSRSGRQDELSYFLRESQAYPLLDAKIEVELARRWRDQRDPAAADQLVGSHLRLVVKLAKGFQGYGLPLSELVAEGNLGLMQAVDKFDPERGFRLSTYAIWWIRAALQEYVLHATSLVKLATTSSRKKLFFNLRRAKAATCSARRDDSFWKTCMPPLVPARNTFSARTALFMIRPILLGRD